MQVIFTAFTNWYTKKYTKENLNRNISIKINKLQPRFRLPRPTKLERPKALIILVIFGAFWFPGYASAPKVSHLKMQLNQAHLITSDQ